MQLITFFVLVICGISAHGREITHASGFPIRHPVNNPRVEIRDGILIGRTRKSVGGQTYYSFQGIPYAKPPVGNLRFQNPQPSDPWNGTLDATRERSVCTQTYYTGEIMGSEDCLFVNVYTPQVTSDKSSLLPVMVWFHPGAFASDSGNEANYGAGYLMDSGVVLVTLNYRLDALGFFSTGDTVISGNMGFKDQSLALVWVMKNIQKFGGDPSSVTIFGDSAGGYSVGYHILSPQSKGLFHRAISMSGSPFTYIYIERNPRDHAFRFGSAVGCERNDSVSLVECLRKVPVRKLIENSPKALSPTDKKKMYLSSFSPVTEKECEGAFITEDPGVLLEEGKFYHVPFLSGFVSNEGKLALQNASLDKLDVDFEAAVGPDLRFTSQDDQRDAATKLKKFYFQNKKIDKSQLVKVSQFLSDFSMEEGIDRFARAIAAASDQPTYFYRFSFESNVPLIWDNFRYIGPPHIPGAEHGADLPFLFVTANGALVGKLTAEQEKVRLYMTTMWTNFAKTGNPTPPSKGGPLNVSWKPFTPQSPAFLDIGPNPTLGYDVDGERLEFWRRLVPLAVRYQSHSKR